MTQSSRGASRMKASLTNADVVDTDDANDLIAAAFGAFPNHEADTVAASFDDQAALEKLMQWIDDDPSVINSDLRTSNTSTSRFSRAQRQPAAAGAEDRRALLPGIHNLMRRSAVWGSSLVSGISLTLTLYAFTVLPLPITAALGIGWVLGARSLTSLAQSRIRRLRFRARSSRPIAGICGAVLLVNLPLSVGVAASVFGGQRGIQPLVDSSIVTGLGQDIASAIQSAGESAAGGGLLALFIVSLTLLMSAPVLVEVAGSRSSYMEKLLSVVERDAASDALLVVQKQIGNLEEITQRIEHKVDAWKQSATAVVTLTIDRRILQNEESIQSKERAVQPARANLAESELEAAQAETRVQTLHGLVPEVRPGDQSDARWDAEKALIPSRANAAQTYAIYGGATIAEVGLNFLAFQLMQVGRLETLVLAGTAILVNVLLPKQMGDIVGRLQGAVTKKQTSLRPWDWTKLALGGIFWVGSTVFVALLRTGYLVAEGADGLLAQARITESVLTFGWLAVATGIGLVVLIRSAREYDPILTDLKRAERARIVSRRTVLASQKQVEAATRSVQAAAARRERLQDQRNRLTQHTGSMATSLSTHYSQSLARAIAEPTLASATLERLESVPAELYIDAAALTRLAES